MAARARLEALPAPVQRAIHRIAAARPLRRLLGTQASATRIGDGVVDDFVRAHRRDVRGDVLKLGVAGSLPQRGRRVRSLEVVDADPYDRAVTFLMDPADDGLLEPERFDCAVVAGPFDRALAPSVVEHAWRALRHGGVLLVATAARGTGVGGGGLSREQVSDLIDRSCGARADVRAIGDAVVAHARKAER
jgi:SAM-dependent methyltransferase